MTNKRLETQKLEEAEVMLADQMSKEDIRKTVSQLEEYEEERKKKYQTLIRIAIEFCVELKDCDFLFKDLFWLFQDENLEELFVKELEPFIMAGKF